MAADVLIAGGEVIDEVGRRRADVLISEGAIKAVGERVDAPRGTRTLDAGGCWVTPGLVDLHTHLRQPGM
jgi:dihydroorotase-like cyclic amidohydrolase